MSTEYYQGHKHVGTHTVKSTTWIWTVDTAAAIQSALQDPTLAQFTTEYEDADPIRGLDLLNIMSAVKTHDLRNLAAVAADTVKVLEARRTRRSGAAR